MTKESILLGIVGIVLGVGIIVKKHSIFAALIPIIVGIALIAFYKEESKLEKRRDKK